MSHTCYDLFFEFPAPSIEGMEAVANAYAVEPFSTCSTALMRAERCLSSWERLPPIHGAALRRRSSSQRSPTPLDRPPWLWVWALIKPGMIRRRLAPMTSALAVPHCPGRDNVGDDIVFDDDVALLAARGREPNALIRL
jgi:hypothetical protein